MEFAVLIPVAAIVIGPIAWVANNWIRARHGFEPERDGDKSDLNAERKITLLTSENERQAGQITRLEERLAVLERIATDPAERVSREIDSLR